LNGCKRTSKSSKENSKTTFTGRPNEIAEIEAKYQRTKGKKKQVEKQVTTDMMTDILCNKHNFCSYFDGQQNVLKHNGRVICWIVDRKKWVSISTWGKGGKNFKTTRVITEEEMNDAIKMVVGLTKK